MRDFLTHFCLTIVGGVLGYVLAKPGYDAIQRYYRERRMPRTLAIDYGTEPKGPFTVTAMACCSCRNAFWVQHVEIEPPKFCPYCQRKFTSSVKAGDGQMRQFLVPDAEDDEGEN